ncbi:MAG TPA: hypothetical protein VE547_04925 [Mycobacteriales bacterium]|nr:hypothetical protein [Mycobacteriales bacterium]
MRSTLRWVAGLAAVLAMTGCGSTAGGEPAREPAGTPAETRTAGAPAPGDPAALVGLWEVTGAEGEEAGAILRLADLRLSIWRDCGVLDGGWRADPAGLFLGGVTSWNDSCDLAPDPQPAWLARVSGYRVTGTHRLLLDAEGATVARLVPGKRPAPRNDIADSESAPPVVTAELRAALAAPAPLPAGLRAATAAELARRWVPAAADDSDRPDAPFAQLRTDGTWTGSDGCNGTGGRWIAGAGGALLVLGGVQTAIGCDNVRVGGWLSDASRAGFAGDRLVLLDRTGAEVARLRAG